MTARGMMWGWNLTGVSSGAKLLAIRIGDYCDQNGQSSIDLEAACLWAGIADSGLVSAISELVAIGLVVEAERSGRLICQIPVPANADVPSSHNPLDRPGWLYIITAGGKTKVGISRDIDARIPWLQTGNPNPITVALRLPDKSYQRLRAIERETHRRLADRRVLGEWFDVGPETAIEIVHVVAKEMALAS